MQNPRLCIWQTLSRTSAGYYWEVFYEVIASGTCDGPSDIISYLDQLIPSSTYVICPGIKHYPEIVRFKTKHLIEWARPFPRQCSDQCSLWFYQKSERLLCTSCHKLEHDIKYLAKRAELTTDLQKISRVLPNSKYPISKLSPVSKKLRVSNYIKHDDNIRILFARYLTQLLLVHL